MDELLKSELLKIFEKKIDRTFECWIWRGAVDSKGYGKLTYKGNFYKAHRLSYTLFNGHLPKWDGYFNGVCVLHKCDNPSCVNPDHLFLGTQSDNMKDKAKKGRAIGAHNGEKHHKAKLTTEQVLNIRGDLRPNSLIAISYGVSRESIRDIKNRITWSNV